MKYKRVLKWIFLLFWMILIFSFSSQNGSTSSSVSNFFVSFFENHCFLAVDLVFLIRKGAHFFEYFILGVLVLFLIREYVLQEWRALLYSFCCCLFYAISDEIHQLFVVGRSGRVMDVIIDGCGALLGILIFSFLLLLKKKSRKN